MPAACTAIPEGAVTEDDVKARLRALEQTQAVQGAGLASAQSTLIGLSRTMDTFAPIVQDVHRIETIASKALDKAEANEQRQDELEQNNRDDRARRTATLLTVLTVTIGFLGLLFIILQFSGLGHG